MKSRVICILIFCLLGGLSIGAIQWLNGQAEQIEERKNLLEKKEQLTAEMEAADRELSEIEIELEAVKGELAAGQKELADIRAKAETMQQARRRDQSLYAVEIGVLPVNYDVENFRQKQRESAQTGLLGNAFGSWFGNITQNTQQDYAATGQENRFHFYEQLTDFLEESYWQAVAAKAAFDGVYLYGQNLGGLETEAELLALRELLEEADNDQYKSLQEELLNALAKYVFDLNCVYLIYNNTLTINETGFLNELQGRVSSLKTLLEEYDPAGSYIGVGDSRYGYSQEEKADRGMRVFGLYAEAMKMQVYYLHVDGGMAADRDLTAYRVGTIHVYSNRGDIVMFLEQDNPYDMSGWEYRFYDHQGSPLYLEEHQGKILFLDGEVAVYRAVTDYLQTQEVCDRLVSNAERMFTDYANGVLGSTYQNYAY